MSASSKKKARAEQAAGKLTEKQQAERKEAAKLKAYTICFAVVLAVLVVIAAWVGVNKYITGSGLRQKNTIALTIGDHKLNNVELNYYYMDAINNFQNTYGEYAVLYGLDVTKPLNEQISNEETGETWADNFLHTAISTATATYAMTDAAAAEGFTLPEENQAQVDSISNSMDLYATLYGYEDADTYIRASYGYGATKQGYLDYYSRNALANAYYEAHKDSLTFDAAAIAAEDAANPAAYSTYNYNQYYLSAGKFLEDPSNATDEQKAASVEAAEAAVKELVKPEITSVEEFDAAIAGLSINEGTEAASTAFNKQTYSTVNSKAIDWITDSARKAGDMTYVANDSVAEDGTTTVNGYYAIFFRSSDDNKVPLVNVRHILVSFEGGTTDESGATVYSAEEKNAAKETAETILSDWQDGDATEESFAEMAAELSTDTGSIATGGLYEDIYPGQMVANFNDWCFDTSRKPGDTSIVETEYGYHIMYFVSKSDLTYRDKLIVDQLRNTEMDNWYQGIISTPVVTEGDTSYIRKDLVIKAN